MSKRFTDTEKWDDAWFCDLSKDEKLLFFYLLDNVDNAGFYEINFRKLKFELELTHDEILGAIKGLSRGLLGASEGLKKGDKIYLKNFLKHQKINPLNPFNSYHLSALRAFEENLNFVETEPFLTNLEVYGEKKKNGETIKKIQTNLLKYLKENQGLTSPLVEVIVKGEVEVKEEVKGNFGKFENLLEIEILKNKIENESTWKYTILRNTKEFNQNFSSEDLENYLEQFFKLIENDGEETKTLKEFKKHFNRWLLIELKNNEKQSNTKTGQGASDDFRAKTAQRLGIVQS